jgi:hypothetical protein
MSPALWSVVLLMTIGQVTTEDDSHTANNASLERIAADLSEFEFSVNEPSEELTLSRAPVLRWSYPARNVDDAAVFVWLSKDRPEIVATVMSYRAGGQDLRRAYEFLSISQNRLSGVHDGVRVWHPEAPGFMWRPVLGAPGPAATTAQRRRQMHDLAATFQVAVQSNQNRYELRLLSRPLYRYSSAEAGILDGALFAFVEGTDPELILALETPVDDPSWKFAFGRLTRWEIEIRHQGRLVSEFQEMTGAGDASDTYLIPDAGPIEPLSSSQSGSAEKP